MKISVVQADKRQCDLCALHTCTVFWECLVTLIFLGWLYRIDIVKEPVKVESVDQGGATVRTRILESYKKQQTSGDP